MKRLIRVFKFIGRATRLEFFITSILFYSFIFIGMTIIMGALFSGINFKNVELYIKIVVIIYIILFYIWVITGVKRCRDIGISIMIFFIPLISFIISAIYTFLVDEKFFILVKVFFILEIIVVLILSIFKNIKRPF